VAGLSQSVTHALAAVQRKFALKRRAAHQNCNFQAHKSSPSTLIFACVHLITRNAPHAEGVTWEVPAFYRNVGVVDAAVQLGCAAQVTPSAFCKEAYLKS
jgi:hypothetical protein